MQKYVPLLVGIVLAAAVGASAAALIGRSDAEVPASVKEEIANLQARVVELEQAQQPDSTTEEIKLGMGRLKNRLDQLERDLMAAAGTGPTAEGPGTEAPPPEASGSTPDAEAEPTALDKKVQEAVAEADRKRWENMGQRFSSMREQREKSVLDKLQRDHGLSPYQRTQLEEILARRREGIGQFFRTLFSDSGEVPDPAAIRKKMEDVQRETDEAVKQLLTPEQYETFKAEDRSGRGPPWMGGSGGRSGGGGR